MILGGSSLNPLKILAKDIPLLPEGMAWPEKQWLFVYHVKVSKKKSNFFLPALVDTLNWTTK